VVEVGRVSRRGVEIGRGVSATGHGNQGSSVRSTTVTIMGTKTFNPRGPAAAEEPSSSWPQPCTSVLRRASTQLGFGRRGHHDHPGVERHPLSARRGYSPSSSTQGRWGFPTACSTPSSQAIELRIHRRSATYKSGPVCSIRLVSARPAWSPWLRSGSGTRASSPGGHAPEESRASTAREDGWLSTAACHLQQGDLAAMGVEQQQPLECGGARSSQRPSPLGD